MADLTLPRVPWDGGPAYYSVAQEGAKMAKAEAAGWSDPAFFPIAVWGVDPQHAAHYKSIGINTAMMANHTPPMSVVTADLDVISFLTVSFPNGHTQSDWTTAEIGSDPRVVGYFIYDEPEQGEGDFWNVDVPNSLTPSTDARRVEYFQQLVTERRALADGRFIANNFAKGILRAFHSGGPVIGQFIQAVDVSAVDFYVYTSGSVRATAAGSPNWPAGADPDRAATYGWLIDQQRSVQSPVASQPAWGLVETKKPFLAETTADIILYAEIAGAVWAQIVHEARGFTYFSHNGYYPPAVADMIPAIDPNTGQPPDTSSYSLVDCEPELQTAVAAINTQVKALAPVINTQSYVWDFGATGIDTMLKAKDGFAYIFTSVGMLGAPGSAQFTLPPETANAGTVTVLNESRTIPVTAGQFTDTFANEYSHHVYKVAIASTGGGGGTPSGPPGATTYATVADLRAYADLTGGDDADLTRVLLRAERDVDRVVGNQGARPDSQLLKFDPASMGARQADALKRGTCAQAEYRIAMGEPFMVKGQHKSVSGPQFSTSGKLPRVGPKVMDELAPLINRWGTVVH